MGDRGRSPPQNLEWGTLMQIVPRFSKIPPRIHQNTSFQAEKIKFFSSGEGRQTVLLNSPLRSPELEPDLRTCLTDCVKFTFRLLMRRN